jgi:hypothetical protein
MNCSAVAALIPINMFIITDSIEKTIALDGMTIRSIVFYRDIDAIKRLITDGDTIMLDVSKEVLKAVYMNVLEIAEPHSAVSILAPMSINRIMEL